MMQWDEIFGPVRAELDLWRLAGRQARLWLRDDDAVHRTAALERLVTLTSTFEVPLLLCVIPEPTTQVLTDWLGSRSHVRVSVHGIGHHNHAPAGEKAQELGPHRPTAAICDELRSARAKLDRLYGAQLSTILVPP